MSSINKEMAWYIIIFMMKIIFMTMNVLPYEIQI